VLLGELLLHDSFGNRATVAAYWASGVEAGWPPICSGNPAFPPAGRLCTDLSPQSRGRGIGYRPSR